MDVVAADMFVQKAEGSPAARARSRGRVKGRAVVERKDGRALRRMTLYLPVDLAKRLALHCVEHERDMSEVVTAAVERELGRSRG